LGDPQLGIPPNWGKAIYSLNKCITKLEMVQIHAGMHPASCGRVVGFISAEVLESYPPSGEPTHPQCRFATFGLLVVEFRFSVLPKTSFLSVCTVAVCGEERHNFWIYFINNCWDRVLFRLKPASWAVQ
jgi:hypothetical protein